MSIDWAAVYRSTYEELVRYLYRKVWDPERARDLAQETFVRALDHEPDDPRRWVFTIATNLARDEARTAVRRKRHLTLVRSEAATRPGPADPAAELERRERVRSARRALDALSERDREVLLLKQAGFSYTEIAAQTGLAVGAIGTTLARARKRLVETVQDLEGDDAAHR